MEIEYPHGIDKLKSFMAKKNNRTGTEEASQQKEKDSQ